MKTGVIIFFSHLKQIYGLARQPASSCPCGGGPQLDHWNICREAAQITIDTDRPITHFACDKALPVDDLIDIAILELDSISIDRNKAN
jgi:hypothetical protein